MFRCLGCAATFDAHHPICLNCFTSHALMPVARRPHAAIDGEMELTDARTLARSVWQSVEIPAYPDLDVRRGALVVLVGPAGSGKSTWVARALDSMKTPALLVSPEEPNGPSLALRLARLGVKRDELLLASRATVDQLANIVRERKLHAAAIDSVQRAMFEARDLRHMLLALPSLTVLFCTSQVNKENVMRGSEELRHEADVVVDVEAMNWRVSKSRYQPIGLSGAVLTKPAPAIEVSNGAD